MQSVDIIAPEGLVVNANYPAAMGGAPVCMGHNILELVMMAMSKAMPTRAAAGWGRRYGQYIYGINPRTKGLYVFPGYHAEGGAGAVYGFDGYQGSASVGTLGEISRPNTENCEIKYPWKFISRGFRLDSSGAGKWRGGPGFHWEVVNLGGDAGMHSGAGQGETTFSHGCLGGRPTMANACVIVRSNGEKMQAKVHQAAPSPSRRPHYQGHERRWRRRSTRGSGTHKLCGRTCISTSLSRSRRRETFDKVVIDLGHPGDRLGSDQDAARGCAVLTFEGMAGSPSRV